MTDRARPGLVALYDIQPGNGAGPFLQPRSPHRAQVVDRETQITCVIISNDSSTKVVDRFEMC